MKLALIAVLLLLFTACDTEQDEQMAENPEPRPSEAVMDERRSSNAYQGTWKLLSGYGPEGRITIVKGLSPASLEIRRRQIGGFTGCNSIAGLGVVVTRSTIDASGIGSTEVGCGKRTMIMEDRYMSALRTVESVARRGDRLILKTAPGLEASTSYDDPVIPETAVGSVTINTHASSPDDFDSFQESLGSEAEVVTSVGDDAYFWGPDLIYVRVANRGFSVRISADESDDQAFRGALLTLAKAGTSSYQKR